MRSWDFDQLKQQYGHVQVPVEQSRGGGDYRDLHQPRSFSATPRSFAADVPVPFGELLEHVQHHHDNRHGATMCMAQHDLFQIIPELEAHIQPPPFQEAVERLYKRNAWIGPAGCSTPLHRDPYRNALCQIKGSKHIELFHSDWCQQIYPFTTMVLRNTSQVDVNAPDPDSFPLFMRVPYSECTLNEGDILYIPRRWWHFVRAETPSISVNYWWTVPS
jgi:lysine-specific demethylase 8